MNAWGKKRDAQSDKMNFLFCSFVLNSIFMEREYEVRLFDLFVVLFRSCLCVFVSFDKEAVDLFRECGLVV